MGNLHKVWLELEWDDFLLNSYTRAGMTLGPTWTRAVKEEMKGRFGKMIVAYTKGTVVKKHNVLIFN
jgi:hypothetical protein